MTNYYILDNFDIERLVCEENIKMKDRNGNDVVICTEEYYKKLKVGEKNES